jgi:hypothetical protein
MCYLKLQGDHDQEEKVEYSGPLLSQSHKVDELLQKHERHIRQVVRTSWFRRGNCVSEFVDTFALSTAPVACSDNHMLITIDGYLIIWWQEENWISESKSWTVSSGEAGCIEKWRACQIRVPVLATAADNGIID